MIRTTVRQGRATSLRSIFLARRVRKGLKSLD